MRLIAFINPNSTQAMTESCALSLGEVAAGAFEVRAVTNRDGPPAIQGEADGKAAVPGLLKAIEDNDDCDGFILGCFDDTGLFEAQAMTAKPVIGIGQAAFHMAALRYGRRQQACASRTKPRQRPPRSSCLHGAQHFLLLLLEV